MTTSVLDIWNQALAAAGGKGRVQSESEASREREICSLHYPLARDCVQESGYWPTCRTVARLALLSEAEDTWVAGLPLPGYAYSYAMPTKYLRAWALTDFSSFEIGYDNIAERAVIYSNTLDAIMQYSSRNDLVNLWTPGQKQATIFGLAGYITQSLTGQSNLTQQLWQKANFYLAEASSFAANEPVTTYDTLPDWLAARGSLPAISPTRFVYPQSTGFTTNG